MWNGQKKQIKQAKARASNVNINGREKQREIIHELNAPPIAQHMSNYNATTKTLQSCNRTEKKQTLSIAKNGYATNGVCTKH